MLYHHRRVKNFIFLFSNYLSVTVFLLLLFLIFFELIRLGLPGLHFSLFLNPTLPASNPEGGLLNAMIGSLEMTGVAMLFALPLGLLIALYFSEFCPYPKMKEAFQFANDVLLSVPSIIVGLFCYSLLVIPLHHFSAWAGSAALMFIALPMIVRTSEDILSTVPNEVREAGIALGAPYWKVISSIVLRMAKRGILTGAILALARLLGETAPLLFTALNNQFLHFNMDKPMAAMPTVIYQYAMSPFPTWQHQAWAGALLISFTVLAFTITSEIIQKIKGHSHDAHH